jgi:undecaprenyl-diphosphatase
VSERLVPLPGNQSFPSGHSSASAALYGLLGALAAPHLKRRWQRILLVAGCVALALLVGFTRIYLAVHYLSDVVVGWALGWTCAFGGIWLLRRWARPPLAA